MVRGRYVFVQESRYDVYVFRVTPNQIAEVEKLMCDVGEVRCSWRKRGRLRDIHIEVWPPHPQTIRTLRQAAALQQGAKYIMDCPRGFANEQYVYLVTPEEMPDAKKWVDGLNAMEDGRAHFISQERAQAVIDLQRWYERNERCYGSTQVLRFEDVLDRA